MKVQGNFHLLSYFLNGYIPSGKISDKFSSLYLLNDLKSLE